MATIYKIHPAIGIARVGNSPDEFFIGPERIGEHSDPPGGFKDSQCRVKRQAARFRIYAHHDDNTVQEITDVEAEITWTVHLANTKAVNPGRGNSESAADLTIDPGAQTLTGPDQIKSFSGGQIKFSGSAPVSVPLGEIRTDDQGRLLVLGGSGMSASPPGNLIGGFWGNAGWYDDVSDGPVSATIKLRSNSSTPPVVSAWAIVTPPKFAPQIDNVITLYDRVFQAMADAGLVTAPNTTSYTKDVYPILQRARDTHWVRDVGSVHDGWTDPVTNSGTRNFIFSKLRDPGGGGGNMPDLLSSTGDNHVTAIQYAHMQRWKDGTYNQDWAGVPPPEITVSPAGLDRAALEDCVGGAFYPGIEAGGRSDGERPIIDAANYLEAFRLNTAVVKPGDMTYTMALPWQADFYYCADRWWPVPRPNQVTPQGQASPVSWARDVGGPDEMVTKWSKLGFVVRQGNKQVEVERCDTATITLLTPHLDYQNVPQGPMGMVREQPLAITFEVISPGSAVTLEYAPGGAPSHPQLIPFNTDVTVGPTTSGAPVATARLWLIYRTGVVGAIPPQTVTVQHAASGQQWTIDITANTIARKTAATALVLDRSGSMSEDRGDGQTKHLSLQQAASIFVDVMLEGDGAGVVSFSDDATVLKPILQLGNGGLSDINRGMIKDTITGPGLNPLGATSIGDGIFEGRGILNAAGSYDVKALTVLTDGVENRPRSIADVAAEINEQTYAIGLGAPQNISTAALQTISGNNGGYLLVTGAIGTDNRFLLQKYFLQILAGVTNAEVVLDPDGTLVPGTVQRIPFQLTDADAGVDVVLLTPNPNVVDFRVQTPHGLIIEPWRAQAEPDMRFVLSNGVAYYRLVLPTQLLPNRFDQGGTWHALLTIGDPRLKRTQGSEEGTDHAILRGLSTHRILDQATLMKRSRAAAQAAAPSANELSRPSAAPTHVAASQRIALPYSLVVHSYSNLSLRAGAEQKDYEPGALVSLHATLAESGLPVRDAAVWAEVKRPDGTTSVVRYDSSEPGRFAARFETSAAGVYYIRVRAHGRTRKGLPFTRERLLSAAVWRGGNQQPPAQGGDRGTPPATGPAGGDGAFCELLMCLTSRDGVISAELEKNLHEAGLNLEQIRKCLHLFCRKQ